MTKRIIYALYIFNDIKSFDEIPVYKLHFECLKYFANIFNKAQFIISVDDFNNPLIDLATTFFQKTFAHCEELHINVEKNVPETREAEWYQKYLVNRLEQLDGYTWFGHSKGVQNMHLDNKCPWFWVSSMYYFSLTQDPELSMGDQYYAYGFPFICNQGYFSGGIKSYLEEQFYDVNENFRSNIEQYKYYEHLYILLQNPIFNRQEQLWQFIGSMYWMNTEKIAKYVKEKNIYTDYSYELPGLWYDFRFIGEAFLPDLFTWNEVNFPYRDRVFAVNKYQDINGIFDDNFNNESYYQESYIVKYINDYFPQEAVDDFYAFHKNMMNNVII